VSPRGLAPLLVLSGAGGLVLEVAWFRRLAQVVGGSSVALAGVLAAVIGGMALGAWIVGRFADRAPSPLSLYARLEFGVALSALVSPWLLHGAGTLLVPLDRAFAGSPELLPALRFVVAVLFLAPLALCLGGTLPAAAATVRSGGQRVGREVGLLYACNTLGAVAGTLLAGFLLLPALGLAGTMRAAAILAGAAGAGARLHARRSGEERPPPPSFRVPAPEAGRAVRLYALSGFLGLSAQVAFTRGLVLVFGSATYAFTTVLAVFLLGIGLGAAAGARLARRADGALARLELCVALTAAALGLAAHALFGLPRLYLHGYLLVGPGFGAGIALRFFLAALVLLPGCLGLGVAFPLAARLAGRAGAGRGTGALYAANTLACVLGSTLATFALVPWLGPQLAAAGVAAAVALVVLAEGRRRALAIAFALAALGLLPAPEAARERLYTGVYYTPENYLADGRIDEEAWEDGADVPFVAFGRESTVALHRWYGPLSLLVDGKAEASEQSALDLQHLALLGHVPMCVHPGPGRVLVVGLGLGKTYEAVARHDPAVVEVVEIEASVVRAARRIGVRPPRVVIADARAHLRATRDRYDVVTSDPIHPWVRGSGDLYTREYFLAVRDRLAEGGVACQWLPLYQMALADVRSVIATFASVFVADAYFAGTDLVLVGCGDREPPDPRAPPPAAAAALHSLGASDLASLRVARHADLAAATRDAPVLFDDALRLEFSAPRQIRNPELADCLAFVRTLWKAPPLPYASLLAAQEAWARGDGAAWTRHAEAAIREGGGNPFARRYVGEALLQSVPSLAARREYAAALRRLARAGELLGDDPRVTGTEADVRAAQGDREGAARLYRALLERQPDNVYLRRRLARVE
jgi:spermidine synthase